MKKLFLIEKIIWGELSDNGIEIEYWWSLMTTEDAKTLTLGFVFVKYSGVI